MGYKIDQKAENFLFSYLNNASPTGFEAEGQKIWLNYIKPFIDDYHVDHYGTVYGVINPKAEFKVVIGITVSDPRRGCGYVYGW